jgi:hypothetical protein
MTLDELLEAYEKRKLKEQPIAVPGDWSGFGENFEMDISLDYFDTLWKKVDVIENKGDKFIIARLHSDHVFIAGFETTITRETKSGTEIKNVFRTIFQIAFEDRNSIGNQLGYNSLFSVRGVYVGNEFRNRGLAAMMYKWIVNNLGLNILGDKHQYFGARKLWTYLSNQIDIQVDLVDLNNSEILETDVILYHGKQDGEYDQSVWSDDNSKANIRPILTKIM